MDLSKLTYNELKKMANANGIKPLQKRVILEEELNKVLNKEETVESVVDEIPDNLSELLSEFDEETVAIKEELDSLPCVHNDDAIIDSDNNEETVEEETSEKIPTFHSYDEYYDLVNKAILSKRPTGNIDFNALYKGYIDFRYKFPDQPDDIASINFAINWIIKKKRK